MLWVLLPIVAGAAAGGAAYGNWDYRNYRIAQKAHALTGGDIARGKLAFARYGCGGCHTVTGVPQAHGKVGPPLDGIGTRGMIAGKLPNKPGNLEAWIQNPQAISPGTAMPTLGVTPADARDLAAFLYTAD
jgi:cytochrome c2